MAVTVLTAAAGIGGCASQVLTMHTLPDETPAADNAAAAASASAFAETAATASGQSAPDAHAKDADLRQPDTAPPVTPAEAPPMYTYDPLARLNRFVYRFNTRFDRAIFLPVTDTYLRLPGPLRSGAHNFFDNLGEVDSIINYALQWRLKFGLRSLERFAINSTIGIGGLFDVATKLKLPGPATGFATTLAKWGMHPGFYLVLPLLGPSTLRDGVGFAADYATNYGIDLGHLYRGNVSWALGVVNAVDQRANNSFRYYSTGSPFEYETVRFLYVRQRLIQDEVLHANAPRNRAPADAPAGK
jgi:phospholipid-binding lipoprotein MlaA